MRALENLEINFQSLNFCVRKCKNIIDNENEQFNVHVTCWL